GWSQKLCNTASVILDTTQYLQLVNINFHSFENNLYILLFFSYCGKPSQERKDIHSALTNLCTKPKKSNIVKRYLSYWSETFRSSLIYKLQVHLLLFDKVSEW